jgi:peptidoglycan/xylan/chitin deacetylase (PgdA/CDA1 family)
VRLSAAQPLVAMVAIFSLCAAARGIEAPTAPPHSPVLQPPPPVPGIVTRLPTRSKVVALTFDACQAFERMQLDLGISGYLVERRIAFTIFMGGRFARDNAAAVRELAKHDFVSIQNHSWSHNNDMRNLDDERIQSEVLRASAMIESVTAHRPTLFRFPAGNADERTVAEVRALGLEVVHWRWAEGDPDPNISADMLVEQTLARTRPGDILVFHINGRGWHTAEALPRIIDGLAARGFSFVRVSDYVPAR